MIRFAIKMTFWGFLGLIALPSLVPGETPATETSRPETGANLETTVHAARVAGAVAQEVGSICSRQPALCESGRALADAAIARAQEGLVVASGLISRARTAEPAPEPTDV